MSAAVRYLLLAAALAFASAASSQPTVTADPAIRAPNFSTLATWGGLPSATSQDRIELHPVGSDTVIAWQYTGGTTSGSMYFWIPDTVAHGTYELWLRRYWTHVATSNPITVSMMVAGPVTLGGAAFAGVTLTATNGGTCTQSSASGQYSCAITSGWSGDVIPSKAGYIFTPASRSYVNVTSTQTAQSFTAALIRVISGTATLNGLPLPNVAFSASGGWSCTNSDAQGQYSCAVPDGWTGTITPSQTGYTFSPASKNYSSIAADDPGEDYTATLSSPTANIAFVHVDHLNTPRLVADASGTTVWRWDQMEPFGVNVPDENPSGLGAFDLPLRLPGQYYDRESALHYNYLRDYDPGLGRYIQSDSIGLEGGLNTYVYVEGNALIYIDPVGLWTLSLGGRGSFFYGGAGGTVGGSVGISTSGQICFQIQTCGRLGAGASIGVGAAASVGSGQFCEGDSLGGGGFTTLGVGPFGGVSTNTTLNGTTGSLSFGGGGGFAAGVQTCITRTFCAIP